jgi:hypothetical protein
MSDDDSYVSELNFSSLVLTLSSSAWVALGKIADPISGEINKDLKGAKYTIDLLVMLRKKTKGNLDPEEERMLNGALAELQSNYAETVFSSGADDAKGGQDVGDEKSEDNKKQNKGKSSTQ